MTQDRLRSTGRKPTLDVTGIQALLERYMDGSNVSISTLAEEQSLTTATVRKYLKAAGLTLPRGRAALKPREVISVRTLMNRMSVEDLLGSGRVELLRRRLELGQSMTSLATEFGLSRDRIRKFRDESGLAPEVSAEAEAPESPEEPTVEESAEESAEEAVAETTEDAMETAESTERV